MYAHPMARVVGRSSGPQPVVSASGAFGRQCDYLSTVATDDANLCVEHFGAGLQAALPETRRPIDPIEFDIEIGELIPKAHERLDILGEEVPPEKPILGRLAFEHESGMHTAAMLNEPMTFESFDPSRFGGQRTLLFGPSSGRGTT